MPHILTSSHLLLLASCPLALFFTSSHPHIFSFTSESAHLHIFSSSHRHIFTSSHLHIFSSCPFGLLPSCPLLHIFSSSHLHIFITFSHLHIFSSCPLAPLALSFFSISLLKAGAGAVPTRRHETHLFSSCPSCPLLLFYFSSEGGGRGSANETARNATLSHEMRFDRQKLT